jgi:heavy metal sensor kinase
MKGRSIGARLTLWYTTLLAATFVVLAGVAFVLLAYSLSHDVDVALDGVAKIMTQQARQEGAPYVPSDIDEIFRRFFGFSPLDRYFELLDPFGRRDPRWNNTPPGGKLPLSEEALKKAARGIPVYETVKGDGPYPVRILTQPVIEGGSVISLVQVGMSLESMINTRQRFLLIMAAVLPMGLLLAGGGGWLLARRALKPVDRITAAAQRISGEHLKERLHETGMDDELDRLAKTLNDMLARLEGAFLQVRQFSADASHELQTPLTILKGELEVALRSSRSPEEYRQVLTSGLEEIDRIIRLVEGLLLLSRADAGVLRMDHQTVPLEDLLKEVYDHIKILAEKQSIHFSLGPVSPVAVQGDYEHLRRLVMNLVDNAIKYTPSEGRVDLSCMADDEWARITVSDTGVGLSPEDQERVFQRFYRVEPARSKEGEGTGLGLCIVRSIAEAHGGRIEVVSLPGQGATFTVLLPLPPGS